MDTYCIEPWRQRHYDSKGHIGPCCFYTRTADTDFKVLQQRLAAGVPDAGCRSCYDQESRGIESQRQISNRSYTEKHIEELFITLGSVCNFACTHCNPSRSTRLASWTQANPGEDWVNVYSQTKLAEINLNNSWFRTHDFRVEEYPDLKRVHLNGGEPFHVPRTLELLQTLPENLEIIITTNGSWTHQHLRALRRFRRVLLEVSIDAVGDVYNIVRYPASWTKTELQLAMLEDYDFDWTVSIVPTALNTMNIPEFVDRFSDREILVHALVGEPHMGVWNITDKPKAAECLRQLPGGFQHVQDLHRPAQKQELLCDLIAHWSRTRKQNIWSAIGWRI